MAPTYYKQINVLHSAWISHTFCTGLLPTCSTRSSKDYWCATHTIATQAT